MTPRREPDELREVGSAVSRVMRRLGAPDPGALQRLEEGWDVALEVAAPHARLVRFAGGDLVVEVDHPAWATRVQMARGRLEALAGESVRLEVRVHR